MVEFFYKGNYTDTPIDPSKSSSPSFHYGIERMKEHAEVYVLANKYLIPMLSAKADVKFDDLTHDYPKSVRQSPALLELVRYIYDNTVDSDGNGVRNMVTKVAAKYAKCILETPDQSGCNTFTLDIKRVYPDIEALIDEYIDAIAEKDEGFAECMLDIPHFVELLLLFSGRTLRPVPTSLWADSAQQANTNYLY